jgi:phage shock protein A
LRIEPLFIKEEEGQMRLLKRLSELMTADLDLLLEQVEDPELTITQLICDMEESIIDLRRETVTAVARQGRLRKQLFAAEEASRGVELQATLALQSGEELRARQILGRKIGALKARDALETELAEASGQSARLVAGLIRMEDQTQLARRKRDGIVRRRRAAEAERRSPHSHPRIGASVFDAYAETVSALEIEAEAAREPGIDRSPSGGGRDGAIDAVPPNGGELEGGGRC